MIDGANVALYGQNFERGGFNFPQIKWVAYLFVRTCSLLMRQRSTLPACVPAPPCSLHPFLSSLAPAHPSRAVIDHLKAQHPDVKPLLLLHVGRTKAPQVGPSLGPGEAG